MGDPSDPAEGRYLNDTHVFPPVYPNGRTAGYSWIGRDPADDPGQEYRNRGQEKKQ